MELNKCEKRVLEALESVGEEYALNFAGIAASIRAQHREEYGRTNIRNACQSLRKKGLAAFLRGLMDYDHGAGCAGSGYSITDEGYRAYQQEKQN